jgi:hypothetical protein
MSTRRPLALREARFCAGRRPHESGLTAYSDEMDETAHPSTACTEEAADRQSGRSSGRVAAETGRSRPRATQGRVLTELGLAARLSPARRAAATKLGSSLRN